MKNDNMFNNIRKAIKNTGVNLEEYNPNFKLYIFANRDDAEDVKNRLVHSAYKYGSVTYADYLDLVGEGPRYTDDAIGWNASDLENISVRTGRGGYYIYMPNVRSLGEKIEINKGDDSMGRKLKLYVGDFLEHKKGEYYQITSFARNSETEETMVVYRNLKSGSVWVRPLNMFTDDRFKVAVRASDIVAHGCLETAIKSVYGVMGEER